MTLSGGGGEVFNQCEMCKQIAGLTHGLIMHVRRYHYGQDVPTSGYEGWVGWSGARVGVTGNKETKLNKPQSFSERLGDYCPL